MNGTTNTFTTEKREIWFHQKFLYFSQYLLATEIREMLFHHHCMTQKCIGSASSRSEPNSLKRYKSETREPIGPFMQIHNSFLSWFKVWLLCQGCRHCTFSEESWCADRLVSKIIVHCKCLLWTDIGAIICLHLILSTVLFCSLLPSYTYLFKMHH